MAPGCMRLVLLAATVHTTAAALALPSVLTTRGHNATVARRVLGAENKITLSMHEDLSRATLDGESSAEDKREALRTLEDSLRVMRRVLGTQHPETQRVQRSLHMYREIHETPA